jgi:hypothetical protein
MLRAAGWLALVIGVVLLGVSCSNFYSYSEGAAARIKSAFDASNQALQVTLDEAKLTNSRLDDEIAMREGHPRKGSQTAMLEAVTAADKLQAQLDADNEALRDSVDDSEIATYHHEAITGVVFAFVGLVLLVVTRKPQAMVVSQPNGRERGNEDS